MLFSSFPVVVRANRNDFSSGLGDSVNTRRQAQAPQHASDVVFSGGLVGAFSVISRPEPGVELGGCGGTGIHEII